MAGLVLSGIETSPAETELYYLRSRYYDPEIGRFISADDVSEIDPETINGLNLYAYCLNNPVMMVDPLGNKAVWWNPFSWFDGLGNVGKIILGGLLFLGAVGLTVLSGGALAPLFIGMVVGVGISTAVGGIMSVASGGSFWEGAWNGFADGVLWGGIFAFAGSAIGAIKYTKNFRVVGLNEFDDIANSGKFLSKGFSEGKYFWTSKSSAKAFAQKMNLADDTFRIVGARVSRSALKSAIKSGNAYYWSSLDSIGKAYFMHINVVNEIVKRIWTVL